MGINHSPAKAIIDVCPMANLYMIFFVLENKG